MSDGTEPEEIPPDPDRIVIEADPGFLEGVAQYWAGQAPPQILDGSRNFPVDAEAFPGHNSPVSDHEALQSALNALSWKLYQNSRADMRMAGEAENYRQSDDYPDSLMTRSGKGPERPDKQK